jgi:1-deoxy-D-xylulose-5-phosphate synthase
MITSSATYNRVKNKIWNLMGGNTSNNKPKSFFKKVSFSVKSMFSGKSNFFEALNIRYFGPVDGHDLNSLIKTLEDLKNIKGPKLLHIITKKGKGLPIAESNPTTYHAPGIFNPLTGEIPEKKTSDEILKFQDVFGETLVELAKENKKIVGITPAMLSGCSMNKLQEVFPERTFDVGIAEEHAVTLSAGFACQGLIPVCNIYSSFMQRAYDQLIHDIALQGLGVVICLDRAGLVGEDGATHHGAFDLAYLNCVPNIIVAAPSDENDLRNMLYTAVNQKSPFVIRYPRGKGYLKDWHNDMKNIEIGKGVKVKDGKEVAILCIGNTIHIAKQVAKELAEKNLDIALFDFKFLKPLDKELAKQALESYDYIITMEDGTINGGFGSSIIEFAVSNNLHKTIERIGIPDEFIEQGSVKELQKLCKIDCESVKERILKFKNL